MDTKNSSRDGSIADSLEDIPNTESTVSNSSIQQNHTDQTRIGDDNDSSLGITYVRPPVEWEENRSFTMSEHIVGNGNIDGESIHDNGELIQDYDSLERGSESSKSTDNSGGDQTTSGKLVHRSQSINSGSGSRTPDSGRKFSLPARRNGTSVVGDSRPPSRDGTAASMFGCSGIPRLIQHQQIGDQGLGAWRPNALSRHVSQLSIGDNATPKENKTSRRRREMAHNSHIRRHHMAHDHDHDDNYLTPVQRKDRLIKDLREENRRLHQEVQDREDLLELQEEAKKKKVPTATLR